MKLIRGLKWVAGFVLGFVARDFVRFSNERAWLIRRALATMQCAEQIGPTVAEFLRR